MTSLDTLITPLDPMDVSNHSLFTNLQGNILKGHGRDHTTHIFVRFDERRIKAVKHWLKEFAEEHVTCFQKQLREREVFKRNQTIGDLFVSFFLTKEGYEYLGFEKVDDDLPDPGFKLGMRGRLETGNPNDNVNNDPPISKWEKGFRKKIHAMILLADDDLHRMGKEARALLDTLDKFSHICSVEYGNAIRNANQDGIEHFGYVDGVSQPLFLKDEVDEYMKFHNTTPKDAKFDPTADKKLVLIPDPYAPENHPDSWGSYFVFRKLEQNVKGFKEKEEKLHLGELGGAYLVGRSEDGTPAILSQYDNVIDGSKLNNFNYDEDPSGGRCPHFAHTRKTNPRKDIIPGNDHKRHIMARRGIPFGHREVSTALDACHHQMPEGGVGLLFMSYQKSIEDQFEFIQKNWANNEDFSKDNTGIDPIIGHDKDQNLKRSYEFPNQYDKPDAGTTAKDFEQFVHMKGGEYFFAPSMSFLKNIDTILNNLQS